MKNKKAKPTSRSFFPVYDSTKRSNWTLLSNTPFENKAKHTSNQNDDYNLALWLKQTKNLPHNQTLTLNNLDLRYQAQKHTKTESITSQDLKLKGWDVLTWHRLRLWMTECYQLRTTSCLCWQSGGTTSWLLCTGGGTTYCSLCRSSVPVDEKTNKMAKTRLLAADNLASNHKIKYGIEHKMQK